MHMDMQLLASICCSGASTAALRSHLLAPTTRCHVPWHAVTRLTARGLHAHHAPHGDVGWLMCEEAWCLVVTLDGHAPHGGGW